MLVALLLLTASQTFASGSQAYDICICSYCTSIPDSEKCDDFIASSDPSFFELLRGKIKSRPNVQLYLTDNIEITLDLNNFGKYEQSIKFAAKDSKSIVNLYYSNSRQYSLLDLSGDNININFKNDDIESNEYTFVIGSIATTIATSVVFEVPNLKTMTINTKYLCVPSTSLANIAKVITTGSVGNVFYMDKAKEITFGDKYIMFTNNGKETKVQIPENSDVSFEWKLETGTWPSTEGTLIFNDITSIKQLPHIKILNPRTLSFKGTLPTIESGVTFIDIIHPHPSEKAYNVTINATMPQLPINVYAPMIDIVVSQQSSIIGTINSTAFTEEYSVSISSNLKEKTEIRFEKEVIGRISCINQYLQIFIAEIIIPKERKEGTPGSPISFGFDLQSYTSYTIEKITDNSENQATAYCFFSHINKPVTGEDLENVLNFTLVSGSPVTFNVERIDSNVHFREDIEPRENKMVHGFNNQANCLLCTQSTAYLILSFKKDILIELPAIVCYGYDCSDEGYSVYTTNFYDMNDLVKQNLLFKGMKEVTIVFTSFPYGYGKYFDLSKLDYTIESVIIKGTEKVDIKINAESGIENITSVHFININLEEAKNNKINIPNIYFDQSTFSNNIELEFFKDAIITIDEVSMNKLPEKAYYPHLVMKVDGLLGVDLYPGSYSFTDGISSQVNRKNFPYDIIGEFNLTSLETSQTDVGAGLIMDIHTEDDKEIRGFNINLICDYQSTITLHYNWDTANFSQIVHVYHVADLELSLDRPYQGDQLVISGKGKVIYDVFYGKSIQMCVAINDDIWITDSCFSDNSMNITEFEDKFHEYMTENGAFKASISLHGFKDDYFPVRTDVLNNYDISFEPYRYGENAKIKFEQTEGIKDIHYTFLTLNRIDISFAGEKEEFLFGGLTLDSCNVEQEVKAKYSIKVDDLTCQYSEMQNFKKVTITDNLVVSGDVLPKNKTDVYFIPDDDAHDLKATIPYTDDDLTHEITVGSDEIILGTITFHLSRSSNYDGLFSLKGGWGIKNARLVIKCAESSDITKMPMISFDYPDFSYPGKNPPTFEFVGQWQDIYDTIFQINVNAQVNIELEDIIPLEIMSDSLLVYHINVTAKGENSGITGPVYIRPDDDKDKQFGSICIDTNLSSSKRVNFTIMKTIISKKYDGVKGTAIQLSSPNIDLYIQNLESMEKISYVPLKSSMDNISVSTINILDANPSEVNISQNFMMECKIESTYDPATLRYLHEDVLALTFTQKLMPRYDVGYQMTVSFFSPDHPVHGFTSEETVVGFKDVDGGNGFINVSLTPTKDISGIPFSIEYTDGYSFADLVISPKNNISILESIKDYIPRVNEVTVIISQSMKDSHPFDLLSMQDIFQTVIIRGGGNLPDFYFVIPDKKTMNISMTNINPIGITKTKAEKVMYAKFIKMTNCNFGKSSFLIKTSSCDGLDLDADSLGQLIDDNIIDAQYENSVNVRDSNIIEFNENGWIVSENGFPKIELLLTAMPNAQFESSQRVQLLITSRVTKINPVNLIIHPDSESNMIEVSLGSGWKDVDNLNNFRINTGDSAVKIITPIYPIPDIFTGDQEKFEIDFGLPDEEVSKDFDLELESGIVYNESHTFDMTSIQQPSLRSIKAPNITFSGKDVKFTLVGKNAHLKIGTATVKSGTELTMSDAQISNQLILDKDVIVKAGKLTFSKESVITSYWTDIRFPELTFSSETAPSAININFDGSFVDHADFNKNVYKIPFRILIGNFSCENYLKLIKFASSITYFDSGSNDLVFQKTCEKRGSESILTLMAAKTLPVSPGPDDDSNQGNKPNKGTNLGAGPMVGIIIACAIVLAAIIGLIVYRFTKRKYEMLMQSQVTGMTIETKEENTIGGYNNDEESTTF